MGKIIRFILILLLIAFAFNNLGSFISFVGDVFDYPNLQGLVNDAKNNVNEVTNSYTNSILTNVQLPAVK